MNRLSKQKDFSLCIESRQLQKKAHMGRYWFEDLNRGAEFSGHNSNKCPNRRRNLLKRAEEWLLLQIERVEDSDGVQ